MMTQVNVLTVKEVSAYLRIHASTVYRLSKNRELPAFRIGSGWRFNIEAIDEAIDQWRLQRGSVVSRPPQKYGNVIPFRKVLRRYR